MSGKVFECPNCGRNTMSLPCSECRYPEPGYREVSVDDSDTADDWARQDDDDYSLDQAWLDRLTYCDEIGEVER